MSVPVRNTRAIIEDYSKGKIGEIIFENYGAHDGFIIVNPEEYGKELGKEMCELYDIIDIDDIAKTARDAVEDIQGEILSSLYQYIMENFKGEVKE